MHTYLRGREEQTGMWEELGSGENERELRTDGDALVRSSFMLTTEGDSGICLE
jgi:hypothetical protein